MPSRAHTLAAADDPMRATPHIRAGGWRRADRRGDCPSHDDPPGDGPRPSPPPQPIASTPAAAHHAALSIIAPGRSLHTGVVAPPVCEIQSSGSLRSLQGHSRDLFLAHICYVDTSVAERVAKQPPLGIHRLENRCCSVDCQCHGNELPVRGIESIQRRTRRKLVVIIAPAFRWRNSYLNTPIWIRAVGKQPLEELSSRSKLTSGPYVRYILSENPPRIVNRNPDLVNAPSSWAQRRRQSVPNSSLPSATTGTLVSTTVIRRAPFVIRRS